MDLNSGFMKVKYQLAALVLLCGLNFFVNNGYMFPDIMEARNLITAREMVEKGNWLSPSMNNYPRLAKPPLPTWVNAALAHYWPVSELAVHRVPSALMGCLLVFSLYIMGRALFQDTLTPFLAAACGSTAYYLILMSRQATWDIYCHAFMAAAIASFLIAWKERSLYYSGHLAAGICLGLSFLSKGPVAFYAMLLPFFISYLLLVDRQLFRKNGQGLLLALPLFLVLGFAWPLYQLLNHTDALLATLDAETTAWANRHNRPFYQYWGFWSHMGIWTVFTLAVLYFPYAKKRVPRQTYWFLFTWLVLMLVLLSLPPEKKERYLLPVLVPLALLSGSYCHYLYRAWQQNFWAKGDKILLRFVAALLVLVCIGLPLVFYWQGSRGGWWYATVLLFPGLAVFTAFAIKKLNFQQLFLAMLFIMTAASLVLIPQLERVAYTNPRYTNLAALKSNSVYQHNFYSPELNPKEIFALGKAVDTLKQEGKVFQLPAEKQFVLLMQEPVLASQFNRPPTQLLLRDTLYYDPEDEQKILYLYTAGIDTFQTKAGTYSREK